ncbi:MAG TPA: LLM class flavin-dependent oxidoreductase [Actinomycetota bacterium]|nr:LLM class flavin-dependent oxidoreductase [Actinomycetota bacterium]
MSGDNRFAVALNGYGTARLVEGGMEREVLPWPDVVQLARASERAGYETVFTPEIGARDAFATLAGLSAVTTDIRLGTGVVRLDRREARVTAMAAATLHELTGGRFVLGIGSSGTIDDTRRRIETLRHLLAGDAPPGADPVDLPGSGVSIYLAALGPRMTELAGEVADGVLLNWCTPQRVAEARDQVAAGARRAGRDPAAVSVAVYVRACLNPPGPPAVEALRAAAAQYAAMPRYRRQCEVMGLGAEAAAATKAWEAGDPGLVPDELLQTLCVLGTAQEAKERLAAYSAVADEVVVYPVAAREAASSLLGTIMAVAPDPAVEH